MDSGCIFSSEILGLNSCSAPLFGSYRTLGPFSSPEHRPPLQSRDTVQPLVRRSEGLSEAMCVVGVYMTGVLESRAHLPFSTFWEWWEVALTSCGHGVYLVLMTAFWGFLSSGPGLTPSLWSLAASG